MKTCTWTINNLKQKQGVRSVSHGSLHDSKCVSSIDLRNDTRQMLSHLLIGPWFLVSEMLEARLSFYKTITY